MKFDHDAYFDRVRQSLFSGHMTQQQVSGQEFILNAWEVHASGDDLRFLAYFLATAMHETASTMWPISEYGEGKGQPYGEPDPETGEVYFGRGFVQCTWRENYARADKELGLTGDDRCEWNADLQLDPTIAARTGYLGMIEGWFRSDSKGTQTLARYFDDDTDDAYGAREIINGDKSKIPTWANGVSIGHLIEGYHGHFVDALVDAAVAYDPGPAPQPEPQPEPELVTIGIKVTPGTMVAFYVNGKQVVQATAANGEEAA